MSKANLQKNRNNFQAQLQSEKNDFLQNGKNSKISLNQSKISNSQLNKSKISESQQANNNQDLINQNQQDQNQNQNHNESLQKSNHSYQQHQQQEQASNQNQKQLNNSNEQFSNHLQNSLQGSRMNQSSLNQSQTNNTNIKELIKKEIKKLEEQLEKYKKLQEFQSSHAKTIQQIQQKLQTLNIKLRIREKIDTKKELISFQRINHLQLIFKHYCTHIFKTGKHMTFDRLQYQKIHLTIDRLCVLLKDFSLTSIKMKDGKIRQIIQKQQIIKLFKKISPNCRDLDFQQFIIMIQKLGELYFQSKSNYYQRKQNQRKQRLRLKQILQKKQKYKQQMLKKYKQKQQRLQRGDYLPTAQKQQEVQGGQNDDLIQKLIKQDQNNNEGNQQNEQNQRLNTNENKTKENEKQIKNHQQYYNKIKKTMKNRRINHQAQKEKNILDLTRQQKIQYFYEIINVDDIQSFTNKMRQLNLPLFKIYANQNQNIKQKNNESKIQKTLYSKQSNASEQQTKRLKQLRQKLNERSQRLKHASTSNISKQQYFERKMKRSRDTPTETKDNIKSHNKQKKIDITESQINLSSLSKLAYQNINFTKFNPKNFYSKEEDDQIYLRQYGESPVRTKKPTQIQSKPHLNTNRVLGQKQKSSQSFLQKLKQRQNQVQISEKNSQVSQMYRFNDRTQRQKRLIDKFLEKNK